MKYCPSCGAQIEDDTRFCPSCGSVIERPAPKKQLDFSEKISQLNDTADTTAEYDQEDIEKNKVMAILAYILFLIPLLAAKESRFARFHTNQGLLVFLLSIVWSTTITIFGNILPILGGILFLGNFAILALIILGIVNVCDGKAKELPVIGNIKLIKY